MMRQHQAQDATRGERGASIIIALVFMLICTMVAVVIMNLASAAAERSQQRSDDTQAYQAVSSASGLAHDAFVKAASGGTAIDPDLSTLTMTVSAQGAAPTFSVSSPAATSPTAKVETLASAVMLNSSGAGADNSVWLEVNADNPTSGDALPTARVTYQMDSHYNITLLTTLVDSSDYAYTLFDSVPAQHSDNVQVSSDGTWVPTSYPYTVTWGIEATP